MTFMFLVVYGNTENMRLIFQGSEVGISPNRGIQDASLPIIRQAAQEVSPLKIDPDIHIKDDFLLQTSKQAADDRVVVPVSPNFGHKVTQTFHISGEIGSMYEVRVCWPASFPTKFELNFFDFFNGSGVVTVAASPDYYSSIPQLMKFPLSGKYEIIINKIYLDALPKDIIGTISFILIGLICAFFISDSVVSYVSIFDSW